MEVRLLGASTEGNNDLSLTTPRQKDQKVLKPYATLTPSPATRVPATASTEKSV